MNDENEPIPYANIFINQLQTGTTSDFEGYFYMTIDEGEYDIVFSSLGYESKTFPFNIRGSKEVKQNVYLSASSIQLNEIVVKASKKDPAYEIIQKVIQNKKKYLKQVDAYKTNIYVKATEIIDVKEKKKKDATRAKKEEELEKNALTDDPFAAAEKEKEKQANSLNILEMELTLNYQYPKKFKEERTAYTLHGSKEGLFIPTFSQADFNFYRNMLNMKGLIEVPIVSPISATSILSYKYKLIETKTEGNYQVHKIKVTPRKKGNATCSGYLYINEDLWNINRLDLNFEKGALKFYDAFNIEQTYQEIGDSIWIPMRQNFTYKTKVGKKKLFSGSTLLYYSNYELDYPFSAKFFDNEVSLTTKEAYKKDSTFWKETRPEPLSKKELQVITYRDSVKAVHNSKAYQDSVQTEYNKIKPLEILWDGIGWRNNEKKSHFYLGSLPTLIDWEVIGGWRVGPFVSYSRRFENGQYLFSTANLDYGLKNKDLNGSMYAQFRYDPHKLADVYVDFGRHFEQVNSFDAYINQLKPSNYILNNYIAGEHRFEIINGLFLGTNFRQNDRQSVEGLLLNDELSGVFEEDQPIEFEDYQAFISTIVLSFTPAQKYMTEPTRKVVLGSKYPTFKLRHRKGWNKIFGSDIDFDFLEAEITQDLTIGTIGNSKYNMRAGKFVNTKDLRFIDVKRFRESDPYLYSAPLNAFQALDTSLVTTNLFFEIHHIHHFNGALINNIPLVKLLRLRAIVGGGYLWVKDSNIQHQELFAGVERVFKLGARRRLRLGVIGVFANSNFSNANTSIKFSIDLIDTWKRNWNY